jgi:hypothetical protein
MSKIFRFFGLGGVIVLLFAASAFASLTLDIGTITDQGGGTIAKATILANETSVNTYLDCYHANPTYIDPRTTTNKLNVAADLTTYNTNPGLDPVTFAFDYSPGKYHGYITSDDKVFFVRGASDTAPGGTVYIRVWSGIPNTQSSYYCLAKSFSNGALSGTAGTLLAATDYKADVPYAPLVWKFAEATTTIINPASITADLTAFSKQPAPPADGLRQITARDWKMWVATAVEPAAGEGVNDDELVKSSASINAGETYSFKAAAKNWFSEPSYVWGSSQDYEVGGSIAGGGVSAIYNFTTTAALGVNQFSLPMAADIMFDGTTSITTMQDLIDAINASVGPGTVKTAGWWLASSQTMIGWTNLDSTPVSINGAPSDPSGESLTKDKVYQMSVTVPVSFTLTGTR